MRFTEDVRSVARLTALVLVAISVLFSGVLVSTPAQAVGTQINTNICYPGSLGSIVITSPTQNTTTGEPSVVVEGEVSLVSQLMLYVDGDYRDTIPLPSNAIEFSHTVTLAEGEQVIRIEGQDLCMPNVHVAELSVTYKPTHPVVPVTGQSDPDVTKDQLQNSDVAVSRGALSSVLGTIPGIISNVIDSARDALIVTDLVRDGSVRESTLMILRFIGLTAGIIFLVFAKTVKRLVRRLMLSLRLRVPAFPRFMTAQSELILRLVGAGLIAVVFLFLG